MAHWTNYLTFDVLGKLGFGESFGAIASEKNRWVLSELMRNIIVRYLRGLKPVLYSSPLLRRLVFDGMRLDSSPYTNYVRGAVAKCMSPKHKSTDRDFVTWLLEAKDPTTGEGFELNQVLAESGLLIVAGTDTTSTAMSALLFYLTRNPEKLAKLSAEVTGRFATIEDIHSGPELNDCHYLRACIDEAMRLTPPVPSAPPRTAMAGGMDIDGQHIPEGVNVGTVTYTIHHNPKHYPDPYTFKPERWILNSEVSVTAESIQLARDAFCPFSIGPRGCLGKNMAYLEMMIAIGRLIFTYNIRRTSDAGAGGPEKRPLRSRKDEFQLIDHFVCDKDGPEVAFTPRTSVAA